MSICFAGKKECVPGKSELNRKKKTEVYRKTEVHRKKGIPLLAGAGLQLQEGVGQVAGGREGTCAYPINLYGSVLFRDRNQNRITGKN